MYMYVGCFFFKPDPSKQINSQFRPTGCTSAAPLFFHYHCINGLKEGWYVLSLSVCLFAVQHGRDLQNSVYPLHVYYFKMPFVLVLDEYF